jgi:hypothetical protein
MSATAEFVALSFSASLPRPGRSVLHLQFRMLHSNHACCECTSPEHQHCRRLTQAAPACWTWRRGNGTAGASSSWAASAWLRACRR